MQPDILEPKIFGWQRFDIGAACGGGLPTPVGRSIRPLAALKAQLKNIGAAHGMMAGCVESCVAPAQAHRLFQSLKLER
jgi:hypothetical protein